MQKSKYPSLKKFFLKKIIFFIRGGGLFILDWAAGIEVYRYGPDLYNGTICIRELVVTAAISGARLLGLMQENSPLSITACAEWCYTLWTWKMIRLRNFRWGSEVTYCCSCLVRNWSLQSGGSLRVERILRRSGITWTSVDIFNVPQRVGKWDARVAILDRSDFDHYTCPPLFCLSKLADGKPEERSW